MKTNRPALDTDLVMMSVYNIASNDLVPFLGSKPPKLDSSSLSKYREGFKELETHKWSDPLRFKAKYQLSTLAKRYIFRPEARNAKQLEKKAYTAFLDTQTRISAPRGDYHPATMRVLGVARGIIRDILGKYDPVEHAFYSRFGKRAAVGLTYLDSYLDKRVEVLTGSATHLNWFSKWIVQQDDILQRACKKSPLLETNRLSLTTVPKTWNKLRTILKNTVVGGFYTAGLGDLCVAKLKSSGYNLARRPDKHRAWLPEYSRTLSHVTADLSAASDSFTWSLMNRLFPRDWYRALRSGAIRDVEVGGRVIQLQSFMTMGMGFTFPCQTIAFLALLRSIRRLTGTRGRVSVFGDDLIYPRAMHHYVVKVLTDLDFLINEDKTFHDIPFRESCGADFYDGTDVRPYQPDGSHEVLFGLRALAHLYKVYNGLQQRWTEDQLPATFAYLRLQILRFTEEIHQVPDDYPEYSGIQTAAVRNEAPFLQPLLDPNGSGLVRCLSFKARLRKVPVQIIYLWDSLRAATRGSEVEFDFATNFQHFSDRTTLIWRRVKKKLRHVRKGRPPYRRVLSPFVTEKGFTPQYCEEVAIDHRFVIESKVTV